MPRFSSLKSRIGLVGLVPILALLSGMLVIVPTLQTIRIGGTKYNTLSEQAGLLGAVSTPSLLVTDAKSAVTSLYVETYVPRPNSGEAALSQAQYNRARTDFAASKLKWSASAAAGGENANAFARVISTADEVFALADEILELTASRAPEAQTRVQLNSLTAAYVGHQDAASKLQVAIETKIVVAEKAAGRLAAARIVIVGLVMLTLAAMAAYLSRRMVQTLLGPVDALTTQAAHAANVELPQIIAAVQDAPSNAAPPQPTPFPEIGGTEFAQLAAALNAMQDTAVGLALAQTRIRRNMSESLVNLGRRNQGLLSRTLGFITELEENERDPQALANLFRLDHLTTRMRRNAESLLVLAGSEPPRTWSEPVAIGDVLRAALSEVESYDRVDLGRLEPAMVKGTAVSDVAHLVAELLENATNFSPPSTRVDVSGRSVSDGYLVSLSDHGIGMSDAEIAEVNLRLAQPAGLDASPSKVIGHFVVSHLAARHGIRVWLSRNIEGTGVTAELVLAHGLVLPALVGASGEVAPMPKRAAMPQPPARTTERPSSPATADPVGPSQHALPGQRPPAQTRPLSAGFVPEPLAPASTRGEVGPGGLTQRILPPRSNAPDAPVVVSVAPPIVRVQAPIAPEVLGASVPASAASVSPHPLPQRERGQSWVEPNPVTAPSRDVASAAQTRSSLSAFQQGVPNRNEPLPVAPFVASTPIWAETTLPVAPEVAPAIAMTESGLPLRQRGAQLDTRVVADGDVGDVDRSATTVRSSLAAFQSSAIEFGSGASQTHGSVPTTSDEPMLTTAGLPLRAPGRSWDQPSVPQPSNVAPIDPELTERKAEQVRSSLSAFQNQTTTPPLGQGDER